MKPSTLRRFTDHKPVGRPWVLAADHPAIIQSRTRYPSTVRKAFVDPLKSGHNSRKIGKVVTKGKWRGFPIYTLTLEERATCPRSCQNWLDCYGNKMHWAHRFAPGPELEAALASQLTYLQSKYPGGFVVRLHVLGDFYSTHYVRCWSNWLTAFSALRIFGYTAHLPTSEIGKAISALPFDRFAIRFSGRPGARGTEVVDIDDKPTGIVCPAQTGRTDCCATCALCWAIPKRITFLRH